VELLMPQPQETLVGLLADHNIRVKHLTRGHTEQIVCPSCGGGRTREKSLSVTIDQDGDGAAMKCHRGSCGWTEGVRVRPDRPAPARERVIQKPKPVASAETTNRPEWLYDFFSERKIGARTVHEFGVYATKRWFGEDDRDHPHIVFPFTFRGDVVNRKYRPFPEKQPQAQEKDALPTLFNVDRLGDAPEEIVWVEGEPDVMAMFECGFPHAVTLKDGAPKEATFKPEDLRFEALRTHGDLLEKAKRIVLAGDNDTAGLALREELARRLGRHRCWLVTWPGGCKDACDVLRLLGPEAVLDAVRAAEPYPISGLQRIKAGTLSDLRSKQAPTVMTTGTRASDAVIHLPTEGRLIVVTGYPGDGKTSWVRYVMIKTAIHHDRKWAVFSPEMQPWEQFVAECAEVYCDKPFWPSKEKECMSEADIQDAEAWLSNRVTMLVCDSEDEAPTPDWILERARATVLRDGTTDLVVDPWNEIDHQRGTLTETEYTGRTLQRFRAFGLRHGCNVWIIAHPAKPMMTKPGAAKPVPGPYDISGSSHWFNKTDLGLTVHSPSPGVADLSMWKAKYRRFGTRGAKATMNFDSLCGIYSTPFEQTSLQVAYDNGRWG
jgi:twinkle protein